MQWEAPEENRLNIGGSHMQGTGHLWHETALQLLAQCPESTNAASAIPWLAGGNEKYTSSVFLSQIIYFAHLRRIVGNPLESLLAQYVF